MCYQFYFVFFMVVIQPLLVGCQVPRLCVVPLSYRYGRCEQQPSKLVLPVVGGGEERVEKKIPVEFPGASGSGSIIAPKALKPTVMEIIKNLVWYTVDEGEEYRQENMDRIVNTMLFFYDRHKLFKRDLCILECFVRDVFTDQMRAMFVARLEQALTQRGDNERERSRMASVRSSKKPKTYDRK
jgi:hypothetical protein